MFTYINFLFFVYLITYKYVDTRSYSDTPYTDTKYVWRLNNFEVPVNSSFDERDLWKTRILKMRAQ